MRQVDGKWLPTVTDTGIYGFFAEYRWLSNFHLDTVNFQMIDFASGEHAYQAAKTADEEVKMLFTLLDTPRKAKNFGQEVELIPNWDMLKKSYMFAVLVAKYKNPALQEKLLNTGSLYLEETNYWKDTFWGVCDGVGQNNLGKLTMRVRDYYSSVLG